PAPRGEGTMITIMGARGNTGAAVAARLHEAGEKVRIIGRSVEHLEIMSKHGIEPTAGDVTDAGFLATAFRGAEAVYALIPPAYDEPDQLGHYARVTAAIAEAIRKNRTPRVVFLSSLGAEQPAGTGPIVGLHRAEERLLELPGLHLLILRPGYFYENHFATLGLIKARGVDGGAIAPDVPVPTIAAADIGAFAADALRARAFTGTTVRQLLGPRDLTMRETARILGARVGRPGLDYVQVPDSDFVQGLVAMGFAEPVARAFLEMAHALSAGRVAPLPDYDVWRGPTTFEEFSATLAEAYREL
ncbi:MAG TPA: NAD(P)H-binding protein, partial [Gemmatimonadales bacterium]|nr:NAD(P)H-binding protein [Gemmatimonadales bacterium]